MTSNIIVRIAVVALLLASVLLMATKWGGPAQTEEVPLPQVGGEALDEETRVALGIEGDTPEDTVKTLISNVREQKRQMARLEADNTQLKRDNQSLRNMEQDIYAKLRSELTAQSNDLKTNNRKELDSARLQMQSLFDSIREKTRSSVGEGAPSARPALPGGTVDAQGTVWVRPLDVTDGGGPTGRAGGLARLPWDNATSGPANLTTPNRNPGQYSRDPRETEIPAYTVAKNATLVGATAFTALVGRVPVGDNIVDPYSFKVILGRENLIANGKEIPEMAYAIVSGKAVGDWTLGCVAGDVYSITFVFEDGRIRTLPKPKDITDGSTTTPDLKIGELSDDFGNPCVVGKKITNAGKYLAQRVAATAAGAAARAAAASETTTSVNDFGGYGVGGVTVVDGDKGKFVLNETLAGAAFEASQWIRDRQALEFDAVYVAPGAKVAIHITEELRIDYDKNGRLTQYAGFALGGKHRELD